MVLITVVTGAHKPTYNWGGHIVLIIILNHCQLLLWVMIIVDHCQLLWWVMIIVNRCQLLTII